MILLASILLTTQLGCKLTLAIESINENVHRSGSCYFWACSSREKRGLEGILSSSFSSPKDTFERLLEKRNNERQILEVVEAELSPPTDVLDKLFSRVLFNTTMNYIVPLVKVTLPMHTDQGSTVHLAMQAFLGLFSAIVWVSTLAVPVFLTQPNPFGIGTIGVRRSFPSEFLQSFSFKWKLDSIINEKTAKKIGIQWDPCLDKTICEAHRSPDIYGWMASPFLIFFPAANFTSPKNSDVSGHARAAYHGAFSTEECEKLYHCFFDVLPLAKYLLYAWTR